MSATAADRKITIAVPAPMERLLASEAGGHNLPRWALEAIVAEAVRKLLITEGHAGLILGLSFTERERFLAAHGILHDESEEELREQMRAIDLAMSK